MRKCKWIFKLRRGSPVQGTPLQNRFRQVCDELGFDKRVTVHSLRKHLVSAEALQGMR